MRRGTLAVDAGIAVALAALLLVVSPGVAATALVALGVLVVCGISFLLDRLRGRAASAGRRRRGRRPGGAR